MRASILRVRLASKKIGSRRRSATKAPRRATARNRKNALFADSDQGGANWALLGVANRDLQAHVNPQAWLTDVLTKLVNNWPNSRLEDLMP
jgi:transposase